MALLEAIVYEYGKPLSASYFCTPGLHSLGEGGRSYTLILFLFVGERERIGV